MAGAKARMAFADPPYNLKIASFQGRGRTKHREFLVASGEQTRDEFIAFQAYNQTTFASHPRYYCVRCQARYNARDGGLCGPCIAATDEVGRMRKRFSREVQTEYPL